MIGSIPEYQDWVIPGAELEERWEFRDIQEYPPPDASEEEIQKFIEDAKEAQKAIFESYVESGVSEEQARNMACQWPLREDTPMDIIRNFIGYQYALQEAAKNEIDL